MQELPLSIDHRTRIFRTAIGLSALLVSMRAGAQTEIERPKPNVLLLVDTSGSMEFQTDGTLPVCNEGSPSATNEKSRWIELVEVLTGSVQNYSCWAQDRSSSGFRDEFSLSSVEPYDFGYGNPYHRALSGNCVYGPGAPSPSSAPYSWLDKSVNTFPFSSGAVQRPADAALATFSGCTYDQLSDGLLDTFGSQVRFGLMTFDTRINPGTGLSGTSANIATGVEGTWSYYLDSPVTGHPANCSFDLPQEIGARNAAAPAWEGRMVSFGDPNGDEALERNQWVQEVLLSTRPYGATPIAGLLKDAQDFLWKDTTVDQLDTSREFGPTNDPSWRATNCRKSLIILLTDGEPNLDLRPSCEESPTPATAGRCPYPEPETVVSELRDPGVAPSASLAVDTYVIGFALGEVTPDGASSAISCSELTLTQCNAPANLDPDNPETKRIQACCKLNQIAAAGSVDSNGEASKAFFANDRDELRAIFAEILDDVVQVATRTQPVFGGKGGDTSTKGFKFFSAFNPNPNPSGPAQLWQGVLKRTRFQCTDVVSGLNAVEADFDLNSGDDFAKNLSAALGTDRRFFTFLSTGDNRNSLRPYLANDPDELGTSTGSAISAASPLALISQVPAAAMGLTDATCGVDNDATACRNLILKHAVGVTNEDNIGRCSGTEDCNLLGGIYHSTPTIVSGRPASLLGDDSYRAFVDEMTAISRPSALYTSTVDGILHSFDISPFPGSANADNERIDQLANNELWAFIPPAVLPVLQSQYPSNPVILLDGPPIIKEVVARLKGGNVVMERTQVDAQAASGLWRTVMVQGFGEGAIGGGYFAVDITDPRRTGGEPKFLWQLTRTNSGAPIFGSGGTPLITTIFLGDAATAGVEVPVAVLPGGNANPETTGTSATVGTVMTTFPAEFAIDRATRLYDGNEEARSVTIVRLDTGEVLRTFRPATSTLPFATTVFSATDIPAPIVGQPIAFPSAAGAIAERIFVGDAQGRLYRMDVSSRDPANWTMEVFFDAYWNDTPDKRQPVQLPPMLSVNANAEVTIAFATGDQEATDGGSDTLNRVVSLTEKLNTASNTFYSHVNWIHDFDDGMRVTGPMVLFNSGLYYAASRPPDAELAACDRGNAEVFGVHYELDEARRANLSATPTLDKPGSAPGVELASDISFSGELEGLVFGVSLESQPSCSSSEEVVGGDEGFGYGAISMTKKTKAGKFFLSYEASGSTGAPGGSTSGTSANGVTQFKTLLETPQRPVTFESFALIYE